MMDKITFNPKNISFYPLIKNRWLEFEQLFGPKGACGGCWCMYWRLKRSEFEKQKGDSNKRAMRSIVDSGKVPGIIAFDKKNPIGWCSLGSRDDFPVLNRSRILKKIDEQPVWSIVCFFIKKEYRGQGLSRRLIEYAIRYVNKKGGSIIEAYPIEPKKDKMPPVFAWTGFASAFKKTGFQEVARRSETRPIMRLSL